MSPEQLLEAIRRADAAGDTEAATVLTAELRRVMQRPGVEQIPRGSAEPSPAAVPEAPSKFKTLLRGAGIAGRGLMQGVGDLANLLHEPLRYGVNKAAEALGSDQRATQSVTDMASSAADAVGLPQPATTSERVSLGTARGVGGGGGSAGLARLAAPALRGAPQAVASLLAKAPGAQVASGAGSGAAAAGAREAELGTAGELLAGMAGAVPGPALAGAATKGANLVEELSRGLVAALKGTKPESMEQKITVTLRGLGIDWEALPERVRQGMRQEIAAAVTQGRDLDPEATRRLLDFRRVTGSTPTQGTLTLDPAAITRERNLAKTGMNSADPSLQRLGNIEHSNEAALVQGLDDLGARGAPDAYRTGEIAIGALRGRDAAVNARIGQRYAEARDSAGRSAPLDGAAFTKRANELLDEAMVGGALPKAVEARLNQIAQGDVPFTVEYAEQLKTMIGKLQRATSDGQTRFALGKVREALEATPLRSAPSVNPGNLPAVPGTVPPSPAALGDEAIKAFNRARKAFAAYKGVVEQTPALAAAIDNIPPDQFVRTYLTSPTASVRDVRALRRSLQGDEEALTAIRSHIALHLQKRAMSGADSEVGRFSARAYDRALKELGERKLSVFFNKEELEQLNAIGRVASYTQFQPAGSAVNNSNSGALVLGRGLDLLDKLGNKAPLGIDVMIRGATGPARQSEVLKLNRAVAPPPGPPKGALESLALPLGRADYYGGILPGERE